ncbi:MAG: hypothetical protein ACI4TF_12020 [Oliverpabstia sp.]
MKRNKWMRLLALALSMMMMLTTVACGGSKEQKSDSASEVQQESSEENANSESGSGETTVFTIGMPFANYGNGIHTDKNAFLQLLKDELNVELEFVIYDNDALSMMAASGDVCDMMILSASTKSTLLQVISSGALLPLDDLLEEYGQNILKNIPDAIEAVRSDDGKVYCLPTSVVLANDTPRENGWIGIRARYDVYKAIGSPEITSEDDFLEVAKMMVDYERERTGKDDIYAFSSFVDWGTWPYYICYPFMQGLMNTYTGAYDRETGEYVDEYMDENSAFWNGIEFYNKAYRMGIFDIDGMTQKFSQYQEKAAAGKVLVDIYEGNPDPAICGEDAIMTYLPGTAFPVLCGTYEVAYPVGYMEEQSRAISAKCENPELAMQVWNFMDSEVGALSLMNGVQGEDWEYVDGVPQITETVLEKYKNGEAADYLADRTGANFCYGGCYSGTVATEGGYPVILASSEDFFTATASKAEKEFAQDFYPDLSYPGQVYDRWIKEGKVKDISSDEGAKRTMFVTAISEESMALESEREEYVAANISKLIMAETPEEFEKEKASMIDKFYEIGFDKAVAEERAIYDASNAKYDELFGK